MKWDIQIPEHHEKFYFYWKQNKQEIFIQFFFSEKRIKEKEKKKQKYA